MRILFVISGLALGGAERQIVLLSKEFIRRGHSVSIYTLTSYTARADELVDYPVDLVVDQKRMRLDPGVVIRLRNHIARWQPDILHGFLYDGNLYARLAGAAMGVPVLDSERNDDYALSFLQVAGLRLTRGLSDGLVANSHAGAAFARRLLRTPAHRTHVVWNGIDVADVDRRLAESARPAHEIWPGDFRRLCIVGSIKPQKDFPLALRTFGKLIELDPHWRMVCVGDTPLEEQPGRKAEVIAERDRLGIEPYVKFIGQRRDVYELIASCDVLLVTSVHEGFPNVVLEAMACGTPIASTNYSDVRRILPMAWQVVDSRDPRELAEVVCRCQAERAEVRSAQRQWVLAHATESASAQAMLRVYGMYLENAEARERMA